MTRILDQMAVRRPLARYRPSSVREMFVLRLAQKLGEPAAAEHYAELAHQYSDETLLLAYRRALNHRALPADLGRNFHVELASARDQTDRADASLTGFTGATGQKSGTDRHIRFSLSTLPNHKE